MPGTDFKEKGFSYPLFAPLPAIAPAIAGHAGQLSQANAGEEEGRGDGRER
jgi:hypothetical protein